MQVSKWDVEAAVPALKRLKAPLLLHAETVDGDIPDGVRPCLLCVPQ